VPSERLKLKTKSFFIVRIFVSGVYLEKIKTADFYQFLFTKVLHGNVFSDYQFYKQFFSAIEKLTFSSSSVVLSLFCCAR